MLQRSCAGCSAPIFKKPGRGRWPKWCSESCRVKAHAERTGYSSYAPRSAVRYANCIYCGAIYVVRRARVPKRPVCREPECVRRKNAQRMRENDYNARSRARHGRPSSTKASDARRRAVKRGLTAERFTNQEIFERDDWCCGICGRKVDPTRRWPDLLSASLDHVIPLSAGGPHTRANSRCSHLGCNSRRQDAGGDEQLRLIG